MALKDSEKGLLLGLLGAAICVGSFMYIAKPNYEETQTLKTEVAQLEVRLADLQAKAAKKEEYLAGIEEYTEEFEKILAHFPADLNQEITVMFLEGIKDDNDFTIGSLSLGRKELFYTLGSSTATDGTLDTAAAATDTALTEAATVEDAPYECYRASFPITYTGSYKSLKDVIAYIDNYTDRMTVNTMNVSYDADNDKYTGSIEMKCYSVEGEDRAPRELEIEDVKIGVENIFTGSGDDADDSSNKLTKYDDKDGAEIENNYDFYAMINPADSDVSAKVIGQNGSGKEASVVSSSDNSVSTLSYDFYEVDGKNYCKYTLDNSTSYEAEITSAEDIKLLIQSTSRKNDDDKSGVRITIRNTTSLPVYVKVSGDDTVSPRVNIASKTGSVKVYK